MRSSNSNDLKRIRGIGVLIERKLNSMGVTTYDHIANWTADDIDRVSQSLDFKGRIERENWVEQARILSAGGQTEFSRRVDRGEVETSRPRT
jgi:predicted flap endonuclease-1-like 5' DNA nuclease